MKDYQSPNDAKSETAPSSAGLSETGQRAMQGRDVAPESAQNDDMAALERRVEQLRAETEAREAVEKARWEQSQQQPESVQSSDHDDAFAAEAARPAVATTELGKARQVEAGAEMPERKLFSDIDETRAREGSIYREGRLR